MADTTTDARDKTIDSIEDAVAAALVSGALPGETDGFDGGERRTAARLVAGAIAERVPGKPSIRMETSTGDGARRCLHLAVVNDDMPFLVDSIAGAVAARGLAIHRLLHPIVAARRDGDGRLLGLSAAGESGARHESIVYMELERADARDRRALADDLETVLADVRAAVVAWPAMVSAMRADADALPDGEGAALLRWLVDRNFTLLGRSEQDRDGAHLASLGICETAAELWRDEARVAAIAYFEGGGEAPLLLKSARESVVHRRAPLDLVIVPRREQGRIVGLAISAGLWTSAALAAAPEKVPVLRTRLRTMLDRLGFDSTSHAGKALRHAFSALPHDLATSFPPVTLERIALTAMSLADRPRPKLLLAAGPIGRVLFGFVWLPREELTTARRFGIGDRIAAAAQAHVTHWSVEAGDGDLALIRYTVERDDDAPLPDEGELDRVVERMVRGWAPAVEDSLARVDPRRAAGWAGRYAAAFSTAYRETYGADEAAADIDRLRALEPGGAIGVRLHRLDGDALCRIRLKTYRMGEILPLSAAVPAFENFGFRVIEEIPTSLEEGKLGTVHDFLMDVPDPQALLARAGMIEAAVSDVLDAREENDAFNSLLVEGGLDLDAVVLFRAWFRYLRQAGLTAGLTTVVDALRRAPGVAQALIALFRARHAGSGDEASANAAIEDGLAAVVSIDDDRILRRIRNLIEAILRTNAFAPAAAEALAFKLDSGAVAGLPAPRPWREIWVYSPRVEGIHLRGGPIARGGLRWSDRRDDFRTEILGLMKAQVVKNAVIVPTGAKGGFYAKQLPSPADREAWMAEGTESYRIFIRTLLSITDNLVDGAVVHPEGVRVLDGDDPYFVVAADKGTASFSDVANAIAIDRGFWLGDAFASGGSHGYDHKAMGITAKGAWVSVTRHFAEMGVDVASDPVRVVGCGDMSGDVFGNGMLLSKSLRLVAAFDHRHIFLDPDPDPETSWAERSRMFALPRSSWADYDASLISAGGGVFPRSQKDIPLSDAVRAVLGIADARVDPSALIAAILKAPVDLLWFGGIGTYVKSAAQNHLDVGDPANDAHRVNGREVRAKVIGEGANLAITQAGRIEFARAGGRINTDFIDNSAGVDCSDNEVNIKIPLNGEMLAGRLGFDERNTFLAEMTDDVAAIVLEDNRLQTLALSLAERGGTAALPAEIRVIEMLETRGRLDRAVEGLGANEELLRRGQDGGGLSRPELAVLLAHSKLALQEAIERTPLGLDPSLAPILHAAFPPAMRARFGEAIACHRLRGEIVATKIANQLVNRLGFVRPFELADEEGAALAHVAAAYLSVQEMFGITSLWDDIDRAPVSEEARLRLLDLAAGVTRLHMADVLRAMPDELRPGTIVERLGPGVRRLEAQVEALLRAEARALSSALSAELNTLAVPAELAARIVRLADLDGAIGTAALAVNIGVDEIAATEAYVRLGEALGLDWAKAAALRFRPADPWERLLAAGLLRDFEQLRLDFLAGLGSSDPLGAVNGWIEAQAPRISQFRTLIDRARAAPVTTAAMLAQVAGQARALLGR